MRSFKEFLLEEDDDKKEPKKDSEKKSEKKEKDKKDDKKKEEKVEVTPGNAYLGKWNKIFGRDEYDDHMDEVDGDVNKEKQMHYVYNVKAGDKSLKIDLKSVPRNETAFKGNVSGMPSGLSAAERGKLLGSVIDSVSSFVDRSELDDDVEGVVLYLPYKDEQDLKDYKELSKAAKVDSYRTSSRSSEAQKHFVLTFTRT